MLFHLETISNSPKPSKESVRFDEFWQQSESPIVFVEFVPENSSDPVRNQIRHLVDQLKVHFETRRVGGGFDLKSH